jgi:hypothetical protein
VSAPRIALLALVALAVAVSDLSQGCGGSGRGSSPLPSGVTFEGNVAAVLPPQASLGTRRWLARVESYLFPRPAIAQSTCAAKHVLACVTNGRDPAVCSAVNPSDCRFSVSTGLVSGSFAGGAFGFADDTNENGAIDPGEAVAFFLSSFANACEGSVLTLNEVFIDFSDGFATAASVDSNQTCPTPTPTPTGRPTPSPTPTK